MNSPRNVTNSAYERVFGFVGFLYFWSVAFVLITTLIAVFKKENDCGGEPDIKIDILQNYKLLWRIFKLPNVRVLAVALLTMKVNNDNVSD